MYEIEGEKKKGRDGQREMEKSRGGRGQLYTSENGEAQCRGGNKGCCITSSVMQVATPPAPVPVAAPFSTSISVDRVI